MLQEQITLPVGAILQDMYGEHYRVESLLGKGGSGAVYMVSDRQIEENVFALKELIHPSGQDRKRLLFECEILKRLDHKSLPRVYHVFEHEKLKRVYLLMEYIKGKNLEDLRREQPGQRFSLQLTLAIMTPIVDALVYLHRQEPPIVHRDIKPANMIMPLDGNEAVLVDFSTAKEYFPEGTITIFGHFSPGYAAIEQYSARSGTDLRADVYGLGATLYTLLTGVTPVDAVVRITTGKGSDPLRPASSLISTIPKPVSNAIQRALSIYKEDRFPTVEAFWNALCADSIEQQEQALLLSLPDTPLPPMFEQDVESITTDYSTHPPDEQQSKSSRKRVRVSALFLVLLLPLVLSLGFLLYAVYLTPYGPSTVATTAPRSALTPTPKTIISPTANTATLYPPVAPSYAGEINDIGVAHAKTNMYLTQVKQDQNRISGNFQGLGQVGPFIGTVTSSEIVHFTVKIDAGMLIFDGSIKIGGDIRGTFKAVDQRGQSLGEYGDWNVSVTTGA